MGVLPEIRLRGKKQEAGKLCLSEKKQHRTEVCAVLSIYNYLTTNSVTATPPLSGDISIRYTPFSRGISSFTSLSV